jgi:hypothetical protein
MKVADLVHFLSGPLGGWPESDASQRARRLRESRMLPSGGHGVNAPHIGAEHAATLLIGLAACRTAADVVPSVATYAPMIPVGTVDGSDFLGCGTFADAMEKILGSYDPAKPIARVIVHRSWPQAEIYWRKGRSGVDQKQTYRPAESKEVGYGFLLSESVTIDGALLHQLSIDLDDRD